MNERRRSAARLAFYRDLFLFWPFLLSSWIAGALLFSHIPDERAKGLTCAAIAMVCLLASRRRLALVVAAIAFMASRFVQALRRPADLRIDVVIYVVGALLLWAKARLHESKSFRCMLRDYLHEFSSDEPTLIDILVNLAGLLSFFVVTYSIFR